MERRYTILLTTSLGILILDQFTKALVHRHMHLYESIPIIKNFFAFTYIKNPGAAFGLLAGMGENFRFYFFITASILALILLGIFFYKTAQGDLWGITGISLVAGGALGNLVDRLRLGEVIDFLDFSIGPYHWPAFNVADSAITTGMVLLIIQLLFRSKQEAAQKNIQENTPKNTHEET